MPKIKEVYEYNNGSWANGTPIGADASNVDVALSDSTSTKDLQSVLGNVSVSDPSMKTQLTGKVNASGGDIKDTVVSVLDPASETDTSEDIDGTDVVVAAGESQTTMWSKFNMFRKRVSNKFSNFLISSVEDVFEPSDTKTYSQAALNSYFADVIGYKTDADVATVGSVADQLSTLNNNVASLDYDRTNYSYYHKQKYGNTGTTSVQPMVHEAKTGVFPVNSSGLVNLHDYFGVETSNCINLNVFSNNASYFVAGIGVWNNYYYAIIHDFATGNRTSSQPNITLLVSWDHSGTLQ